MASDDDDPTPDEPGETSTDELSEQREKLGAGPEPEPESEPDSSEPEPGSESVSDAMKFGTGPETEEGEGKASTEEADGGTEGTDQKEPYDPNKLPALSERATLFGAWGCVGILAAVVLVFFVLIKSAIDKIDDYGAVDTTETEPDGELPPEELAEPDVPAFTRTLEWAPAYPPARAAARIELRPIVIVFTAEYATESIDVFDGVFTNDDVESFLDRYFQVVHIDMGEQPAVPDPAIALCEVEFLPHICYLHPETEERLTADTTGLVSTSKVLRDLGTALGAYEASTDAE